MKRMVLIAIFSIVATTEAQVPDWSILIEWDAPGDADNSGPAAEYDIRYSTNFITETNWDLADQVIGEPVPKTPGAYDSLRISSLLEDTDYYVAMRVRDESYNWSLLSGVLSINTSDQTAPATILDFR